MRVYGSFAKAHISISLRFLEISLGFAKCKSDREDDFKIRSSGVFLGIDGRAGALRGRGGGAFACGVPDGRFMYGCCGEFRDFLAWYFFKKAFHMAMLRPMKSEPASCFCARPKSRAEKVVFALEVIFLQSLSSVPPWLLPASLTLTTGI